MLKTFVNHKQNHTVRENSVIITAFSSTDRACDKQDLGLSPKKPTN